MIRGLLFYSHFPCKSKKNKRADERTRTADLLITSDNLRVAERCTLSQKPLTYADYADSQHAATPGNVAPVV
jgi:hypothetical protein